MEKIILISIDGMRSDGFLKCGNPFCDEMMKIGSYTLTGSSMIPSVTLPCHLSVFYSVPPERHGITTNAFSPFVRPIDGLFERIKNSGGVSAMYYGWEPLRDVSKPASLTFSGYINAYSSEYTDAKLTDMALDRIKESEPDFIFLYMVETDEKGGHDSGWMSDIYLDYIYRAIDNVKKVYETAGDKYSIIVMADHGGHERSHGTQMPEDMTVPFFFIGKPFEAGRQLENLSLLDLAPTIAKGMEIAPAPEWEGRSII